MEPSGAADPGALYDPLKKNGFTKNKLKNLFILDPTRIEMFEAVLEPYLAAAIPLADEVVINKIDVATETEIEMAEAVIKNYKPELAGLKINVNEIKMDQLQELLKFK
jgi:G3E family GTPase